MDLESGRHEERRDSGLCETPQPSIRDEMLSQRAKVSSLESTIRQLREELRESKDQNELLEFRLLEIEELGSNSQVRFRNNS